MIGVERMPFSPPEVSHRFQGVVSRTRAYMRARMRGPHAADVVAFPL